LSYTGVVIARNLIQTLGISEAIHQNISILERHQPYYESDNVLNIVYNFLNGGEALLDIEKLIVKLISRMVRKSGKQEKLLAGIEKNMIRHPARIKNSTKELLKVF